MMMTPSTIARALLIAALLAPSFARAESAPRTFVVTAPPLALPLILSRSGVVERGRLDLPAVGDTVALGAGRRVQFLANGLVPATLETERGTSRVVASFEAASCVAGIDASAHVVRRVHLASEEGAAVATFEITSELDVFGLADESPHLTMKQSTARAVGALGGLLEGAELAREIVIATPSFPLELAATGTSLSLTAQPARSGSASALEGTLVLERRLSPGAVRGEEATRLSVELFDADGTRCGHLVARAVAHANDPDRWESSAADPVGVAIVWSHVNKRWSAALKLDARAEGVMSGTGACRATRAVLTLGDSTSPFVVQASGPVGARQELAGN